MPAITTFEQAYKKPQLPLVKSGDTVRVHQLIREGNKQRVQIFEGVIIKTGQLNSLQATITVRRIASGVGVEKLFMLHSPNVSKVDIVRRTKVRRNFLSYLRARTGKSARLKEQGFDRAAVNVADAPEPVAAADEAADAEITEIDAEATEQVQTEGSTEEVAKEEAKEASSQDTSKDPDAEGDEQTLPAEEAEAGAAKAEPNKE